MQQERASPQPNISGTELTARLWALVLLAGAGAGLAAGLLMKLLRFVQHLSFNYRQGDFLWGVQHTSAERRVLVLVAAGLIAGLVLYGLSRIKGTGGEDLDAAIWFHFGRMSVLPALARALLSIIVVGMGVSLGREAALKQTGAIVANRISAWFRTTDGERHLLVACGAGAGMAAAYNVPLGGALFTIEVLLGSLTLWNALPALTASLVAVAVSWLMLPNQVTYTFPSLPVSASLVGWAVVAGPLLGLCSVLYVRAIAWSTRNKPKALGRIGVPLVVCAAIGLASIRFPELLGNGKNVVQLAFDNQVIPPLLCWLLVLRPLATVLCLRSGVPGGLFTPTMTLGALAGAVLGQGWSYVFPQADKRSYAAIGAGAMLAAASQGPISSVVFVIELTRHVDTLMVPLLIAVAGATVTARRLDARSIYSARA